MSLLTPLWMYVAPWIFFGMKLSAYMSLLAMPFGDGRWGGWWCTQKV